MPSAEELAAAAGREIPDLLAPGLEIVFCGINPGCYSGWSGHHFARPGNRFWKVLHLAGLTARELSPEDDETLVSLGLGITNLVARTSAKASELRAGELREGARRLAERIEAYRPRALVVLGLGAYRVAFGRPHASLGEQPEPLGGTRVFLVANPSGLQARYQLADLVDQLEGVRQALGIERRAGD